MHKCAKCGRAASSLEEIDAGCPCGSKIFKFDRQSAVQAAANEGGDADPMLSAEGNARPQSAAGNAELPAAPGGTVPLPSEAGSSARPISALDGKAQRFPPLAMEDDGGNGHADGKEAPAGAESGPAPESYHARVAFTGDDVENIKVLTQGVFLLDVNAISKNPVVLKDEDDIYYVKLPLEQKRAKDAQEGGNGKK